MGGVIGPIYMGAILDIAPEPTRWGIGFGGAALLSLIALIALNPARKAERKKPAGADS